jgi:hypothetical protein
MEGLFERGVEEFNTRHFFEAHDTWEELWMETRGNHRLFYQGLIQTAVGFYHFSNGNFKGASSQFDKALAKLDRYLPAYHGVDTQQLVGRVREFLRDAELLRNGGAGMFDESRIPQIQWSEEEHNI